MNIQEIETKAETFFSNENKHPKAIGVMDDGTKIPLRLFKSSCGSICHFKKGSHKKGYQISSIYRLVDILPVVPTRTPKTEEKKWQDGWTKVLAKLQKSGLWENVQEEIKIALDIGYDKTHLAYKRYWEMPMDSETQISVMKAIDPRYIFLNQEGKECINSSLVWEYAKMPRVKKMWFGKYNNENYLAQIQKAFDTKQPCRINTRANYDVSFQYKPEVNRAWYSEEYRGAGNGHYYISISETHALFTEDD